MKKIISIIGTGILLAFLAGCAEDSASEGSEVAVEGDPKAEIEKLDLEKTTHVIMQLDERVHVDADVTPYGDYKDGLNVYEIGWPMEGGEGYTTADYEKKPILLQKDLDKQADLLQELVGVDFALSKMTMSQGGHDYYEIHIPSDQPDIKLAVNWDLDSLDQLRQCEVHYGSWQDMIAYVMDYRENLNECLAEDAALEVQQAAASGKEFLEEFVGQELADEYYCIPMADAEENAYVFLYPPCIDGFTVAHVDTGSFLPEDFDISKLSDEFIRREASRSITDLYMKAPLLGYQNGKIAVV